MSSTSSLSDDNVKSTFNSSSLLSTDPYSYQQHQPLPWILHHFLECDITDELPVRVMFSFNSGAKMPSLRDAHRWWNHEDKGRMIIDFIASLPLIPPEDIPPSPIEDLEPDYKEINKKRFEEEEKEKEESQEEISELEQLTEINKRLTSHHHPQDRFMDEWNGFLLDASEFGAKLPLQLRSASEGLPLDFIVRFCLKVMRPNLNEVDFNQALTTIDYLRDYECSRRKHMQQAMIRIGFSQDEDAWLIKTRGEQDLRKWIVEVQKYELRIEQWYAEVFVGIRIWTMVMELKSTPFYKPNAIAMLNTLFPPSIQHVLSAKIDIEKMYQYRAEFYESIGIVEKIGSRGMDRIIEELKQGDKHSWKHVYWSLECYFDASQYMLQQANDPKGVTYHFEKRINPLRQTGSASGTPIIERRRTGSSLSRTYSTNSRSGTGSTTNSSIVTLSTEFKVSSVGSQSQKCPKFNTKIWTTTLNHPGSQSRPATNTVCQLEDSADKGPQEYIPKPSTPRVPCTPEPGPTPFPGMNRQVDPDRAVLPLGYRPPPVVVPPPEKSPDWDGVFVSKITVPKVRSGLSSIPGPAKLPSDNLDFLKRPFGEHPDPSVQPVLKKKSSFGSLFTRKSSANELRQAYARGASGCNVRSTETFARYPTNPRDSTSTQNSTTRPSPAGRSPTVRFAAECEERPKGLKKMNSMTSLFQKKRPLTPILKNRDGVTSDRRARSQTESQIRSTPGPKPQSMPIQMPRSKSAAYIRKDSAISHMSVTPPLYPVPPEYGTYNRPPELETPDHMRPDYRAKHQPPPPTPKFEDWNAPFEKTPQFSFQNILNEAHALSKSAVQTNGSGSPSFSQSSATPSISSPSVRQTGFAKPKIEPSSAHETSFSQPCNVPQNNFRKISFTKPSIESATVQDTSLGQPNVASPIIVSPTIGSRSIRKSSSMHKDIRSPSMPQPGFSQNNATLPRLRQSSLPQLNTGSPNLQGTGFIKSSIPSPTLEQQTSLSQRTAIPVNARRPSTRSPIPLQSSVPRPNRPSSSLRQASIVQPTLRELRQDNSSVSDLRPPPPIITRPNLRHTSSMPAMRHQPTVGSPLATVFNFDDDIPEPATKPKTASGEDQTPRDWLKYEKVDDALSDFKREENLEKKRPRRFWEPKMTDEEKRAKKEADEKARDLECRALTKKNWEAEVKRMAEEKIKAEFEKKKAELEKGSSEGPPPAPTPIPTDAWTKRPVMIGYGYRFS